MNLEEQGGGDSPVPLVPLFGGLVVELSPTETERLKVAVHRLRGEGSWDDKLDPTCESLAKAVKKSLGPSPGSMLDPAVLSLIAAVSDLVDGKHKAPDKAQSKSPQKKASKKNATVRRSASRTPTGS